MEYDMKKLLMVNPAGQFGYHSITYHYCRYLSKTYNILYFCWDYGHTKIEENFVKVCYVSREGNKLQRLWRYIYAVLIESKKCKYDIVYIVYFRMCFLLKLFMRCGPIILDIRTGYVGSKDGWLQRKLNNRLIYIESIFYKNITILSDSLRRDLGIEKRKCRIVPLGAQEQLFKPKDFKAINLLYVGAFDHRCIEKTVEGFAEFYRKMNKHILMSYEIIGYGCPEEVQAIEDAIKRNRCEHVIKFLGRIPHRELHPYLERNNVGMAFVPMIDQYQYQPTTKIFEYHLSGMPVLATNTHENRRYVTPENGVLINDNVIGVFEGLMAIYHNLSKYNSDSIKNHSSQYAWSYIISRNLEPYLSSIIEKSENNDA